MLLYNRERRYDAAQQVLRDLKRLVPRNRVVHLESAATALRGKRPGLAAVSLRSEFDLLESSSGARMLGERGLWLYTRGATRLSLERDEAAETDLRATLESEPRLWVQGRTHLELGKLADVAGDRERARRHYDEARSLCDEGRDKYGVRVAEVLRKKPFGQR